MDTLFQFANVLLFVLAGFAFVLGVMFLGIFFRPQRYDRDKARIYECGEPTIGSSWVRYNIRFYTVALLFLVFDVEIVALLPVAVVLRELGFLALFEIFFFVGILTLGFIYAWRFGALDWITAVDDAAGATATAPCVGDSSVAAPNPSATPVLGEASHG